MSASRRRAERVPNAPPSKYAITARDATPTNSGCFDCKWTWHGELGREEAAKHRAETRHATWTEGRPA